MRRGGGDNYNSLPGKAIIANIVIYIFIIYNIFPKQVSVIMSAPVGTILAEIVGSRFFLIEKFCSNRIKNQSLPGESATALKVITNSQFLLNRSYEHPMLYPRTPKSLDLNVDCSLFFWQIKFKCICR